jgi:hypothetical protein
MLVTEAAYGFLVFYYPEQLKVFRVARDEALIQTLITQAHAFWHQVESGIEPPKDPERDEFTPNDQQVEKWMTAAADYRACMVKMKTCKASLEAIKAKQQHHLDELKAMMGDHLRAQYGGLQITRYLAQGSIQYDRLLQDKLPDLDPIELERYRQATSERCRVTFKSDVPISA